jgi:hypothetical protein
MSFHSSSLSFVVSVQGSISPTFYTRLFFAKSFFVLETKDKCFVWPKEIGANALINVGEIDHRTAKMTKL